MPKRIIYPIQDGGIAVIIPAADARQQVLVSPAVFEPVAVPAVYRDQTDHEFALAVALKDVPHGVAFAIVDVADVPQDRTFRAAWEVDPATLTDGIGAESNEFPEVA